MKKNHFPLARLNLVSNTKLGKINQILFVFKHSSLLTVVLFFYSVGLIINCSILLYLKFNPSVASLNDASEFSNDANTKICSSVNFESSISKLLIFEKNYGFIKLEGQIEAEKSDIRIIQNQIEYKHKILNYQNEIETLKDTIEKIEIEK